MIIMIAAVDKRLGIGRDNHLLCHLPGDLRRFRNLTEGHTVLMGRKTLDSFKDGKPLPRRRNIVLTRNPDAEREGAEFVRSVKEALRLVEGEETVFVIGGESIYRAFLPYADELNLTEMEEVFDADTFFPDFHKNGDFVLVKEEFPEEVKDIPFAYRTYRRKKEA